MNQANKQESKVVLVTGGARRIGAAIVQCFHAAGFRVLIHCNNSIEEANQLAASLNAQRQASAKVIQAQLKDKAAAARLIDEALKWAKRLDVLVNNASIFSRTDLSDFDESAWEDLLTIHVKIPMALSIAAKPWLAQSQGAIINITDIHAEKPLKDYAVYCQSKAALDMQTKTLAREWAPQIRVNAIAPGSTLWPEGENELASYTKEKIKNKTLLTAQGDPTPLAQAVVFLAQNSFITGQILKVDGGRSLS